MVNAWKPRTNVLHFLTAASTYYLEKSLIAQMEHAGISSISALKFCSNTVQLTFQSCAKMDNVRNQKMNAS